MKSPQEAQYWIDPAGRSYPIKIIVNFGCAAIGDEDVGLRIGYLDTALDTETKHVRVQLTPELALQLSAQLREYADRPRKPLKPRRTV